MGVGRYSIDISRRYLGPKRMVFVAGLLTVAGLALVSLGPSFSSLAERESEDPGGPGCGAYIAISMGFAVVGLGLSTTLPIAFILAGYLTDSSTGRNMSVVSTWTNSGNIISPVLVGAISDAISLRLAMGLVGMCEVMLLVLSFRVPDDKYQRSDRSGGKKEEEDGYVTLEGDGNDTLQTPLL
jgi:MFS family permease